jgi:ribonuclease BN (tRNA processing enzyme)
VTVPNQHSWKTQEANLKITILGTSAAYPGPDQACSGFLIEEGNTNLLVDCGTGILSNLQKYLDLRSISDIVITHMHADHFFDLIPYRYALRYGLEQSQASQPRLHLPPGGAEVLYQVVSPFAECESFLADVFEISEYDPERLLRLGNLTLKFAAVQHFVPAYGLVISDTRKLAYSSDSGLCPGLIQVAEGADLFLCNLGGDSGLGETSLWGHLTPDEAGIVARKAGVKRLLLTHLWPTCDCTLSLERASQNFGGLVELAESCHTYDLG